jgi:hypothetical protein
METHFERWMRNEHLLDSKLGIVRYDLDILLHRYMTLTDGFGDRTIQALMFVEVKTWDAKPSPSQADTLHLMNQVLRNRKKNVNADREKWNAKSHTPLAICKSYVTGNDIALRMFGGHVLTFEKDGPDNSDWIRWDKTLVTKEQLLGLLTFTLNPDDPAMKMDIRRRSMPVSAPLFDTVYENTTIEKN